MTLRAPPPSPAAPAAPDQAGLFDDLLRHYDALWETQEGPCSCRGDMSLDLAPALAHGRVQVHSLGNGLTVTVSDYHLHHDLEESYTVPGPPLGFSILIDGGFDLSLPAMDLNRRVNAGDIWVRAGALGVLHTHTSRGQRMRGVSIDVPASYLARWREEAPGGLNPALAPVLAGDGAACRPCPCADPAVLVLACRLAACDTNGACGRLRAEALTLDLLAHLLAPPEAVSPCAVPARRRRDGALDTAYEILRAEYLSPPTILELARRVGLNECYLKAGFRERFGTSIASCVRTLRMQEARRLIETQGHGVQQAALAVGLSNPGHFSAAFRKVHGCVPSKLLP
ncbi:helix-turn-helix transcriptional regulator [Pararhodospirillum oryzae]|uniref:HTH araC/xylS-type domain-containing protein n=1 Tax=Pararhodospirillum oryzae TaxID=478448 RepID=A0A512H337_9PROT|nr:AraC family transcriptional regulator [Pararhodospirillum oryzae]GEO79879.1 hypothetical protein ROR02_00100 [Pararhodospirillum oryzae]